MSQPPNAGGHAQMSEASPWIIRFAHLVPAGARVLDLACGGGRHARLFAARGCAVEAVDRDSAALRQMEGVAGITTRCADLEAGAWPYAPDMFGAIVVTNYLFRPHLEAMTHSLTTGGVLLYETFAIGNESYGRPSNPDFLLASGELLALSGAAQLRVAAYEEGYVHSPKPAVVQRIAAVRPPAALSPLFS